MNERYKGLPRTPDVPLKKRLAEERCALERYVRRVGCDLMLYPLDRQFSLTANRARIRVLKAFLEGLRGASVKVQVVFSKRARGENLTIFGDWFLAESITPIVGQGFRHTIITCHAPTILKRMVEFDTQFEMCERQSLDSAIRWLEQLKQHLKQHLQADV